VECSSRRVWAASTREDGSATSRSSGLRSTRCATTTLGTRALGNDFDGRLAWGPLDRRLRKRCVGPGSYAWREGHVRGPAMPFEDRLWLDPLDGPSADFPLAAIEAGRPRRRDDG